MSNIHSRTIVRLCRLSAALPLLTALLLGVSSLAATVTVSTAVDELNGNTTSIANLITTPGGAGISLREAIIAANNTPGADTILFAAALNGTPFTLTRVGNDSTCSNGDLDINDSLTLTGNGPANTIIQGATDAAFTGGIGDKIIGINQDGTFRGLTVMISGVTIRYGRNTIANGDPTFAYTGAGIDVFLTGTNNSTTISNCVITGNENVNAYGGGVNVDSGNSGLPGDPAINTVNRGTVSFISCVFSGNRAKLDGGGLSLYSDIHNITITNCVFTNNVTLTSGNGGGVNLRHSYGGTVSISGCNISSNSSAGLGGGMNLSGNQHVLMNNVTLSNNVATVASGNALGGGLAITTLGAAGFTAAITITNCTIRGNHADNGAAAQGGGVYFGGAYGATLANCTISGNTSDSGAGIANAGSGFTNSLIVDGCTISNNTASLNGGGVANLASISITPISKSTILGNSAGSAGGGLYVSGGTLTATYSRIVSNSAASGRAVAQTAGTVTATNNWWGTNSPAPLMSGTVGFTPWLQLRHVANPGSVTVGANATLTATFLTNSASTFIPASNLGVMTGVPVTFGNAVRGTLSGAQSSIQSSATATATFTATSLGAGSADATVDNTTVGAPITITCPNITASVSGGGTVCAGNPAVVTVTLSGGFAPYTVTLNNGGGTRTGNSPLTFTNAPVGTTTYSVSSGSDSNACAVTGSGSATITVNPSPTATIAPTPASVNANSTGNQANGPAGATTYSWAITNGTITSATNIQIITYTAGASGNVGLTLRVSNTNGCFATSSVNVPINVPPLITSATNATFTVGINGTFTVMKTGTPTPDLSASGGLPNGVGFNPGTGNLTGTPAVGTGGNYPLVFTATNAAGTNVQNFTLTVRESPALGCPPNVTTNAVGICQQTIAFSATVTHGYPTPTVTYKIGTNVITSPYAFPVGTNVVTATATNDVAPDKTCSFTVTVLPGAQQPSLSIFPSGTNVVLCWSNVFACYALQYTPQLLSPPSSKLWAVHPGPFVPSGGNIYVTNAIDATNRFFRLTAGSAAAACLTAPTGLASWWRAESNATDIVSANNGTLQNGATFAIGEVGTAFSFDGLDDAVTVANVAGLADGNTPHTIEAWVKVSAYPAVRSWPLLLGNEGLGAHHWLLLPGGGTQIGVWAGPQINPTLLIGVWVHLAAAFDGTTLRVYTNGVPAGSMAASFDLQGKPLTVAQAHLGEAAFAGLVDELSIYNRALSDSEIAAIYNAGSSGKCVGGP